MIKDIVAPVVAAAALVCAGCNSTCPPAPPRVQVHTATPPVAVLPLHVEPGKRYLVDAAGRPFLLQGDAAWSLIAQPKDADVERYLQDRRSRGFNTILVNLIEHHYADHAPKDAAGDQPFLKPGDFNSPNEKYFEHADWVLHKAADAGFLVLLFPAFLGYEGTDHGWYHEMDRSDPATLRAYGHYVGERYKSFPNIIWMNAGDNNPPDRAFVNAIAAGIQDADPGALQSAESGPDTSAIEYWGDQKWLKLDAIYSHRPVFLYALRQYVRPERMPFFLVESLYENDRAAPLPHEEATPTRIRTQAYQALLSGATGHVFGNSPLWNFNGQAPSNATRRWQDELDTKGSRSMSHLYALFSAHKWWTLTPDISRRLLLAGRGEGQERATAAFAADRSFALIYVPSARHIAVNCALLGPDVRLRWFDPSDGSYRPAPVSVSLLGTGVLKTPGRNADGDADWVLLL